MSFVLTNFKKFFLRQICLFEMVEKGVIKDVKLCIGWSGSHLWYWMPLYQIFFQCGKRKPFLDRKIHPNVLNAIKEPDLQDHAVRRQCYSPFYLTILSFTLTKEQAVCSSEVFSASILPSVITSEGGGGVTKNWINCKYLAVMVLTLVWQVPAKTAYIYRIRVYTL